MCSLGVEAVGGELSVGVMPDPGEGGHVLVEVGLGLVLRGEFEKPGAGVPGVEERLDVDGVPDFGAAEKGAGLGGSQVVEVEDRAEGRLDGRMVQKVADQFDLGLGTGGGIGDLQTGVYLRLLGDLDTYPAARYASARREIACGSSPSARPIGVNRSTSSLTRLTRRWAWTAYPPANR
ncbi:hypothetical protein ACFY04_24430 [Streptomyces sp. NPDC001549]|uniref:hypothetical protein n=1 Tax=Streptomyces sp. NPDC001549 TaxID=3364586 RepID=UPI00368F92C4